jgi:small subunit ribosomal protein S6
LKQDYELMLVLNPALSREEDATARERVRELITSNGGTIAKEDAWGTRRLAYTIKKAGQDYMEGVYHLYRFDLEPDQVASIQRPLLLSEQVLRHMVVRTEPFTKVEEKVEEVGEVEEKEAPKSESGPSPAQESPLQR